MRGMQLRGSSEASFSGRTDGPNGTAGLDGSRPPALSRCRALATARRAARTGCRVPAPPAAWSPWGGGGDNGSGGRNARGAPTTQYDVEAARQRGGYDYAPPAGGRPASEVPPPGGPPPPPKAPGDGDGGGLSSYAKALIAAAFVTGLGAGVYFDAEINLSPNQVASTEIIDRRTPNSEVCMAYGYSAMVFDQRVFVTYNPFNLYVTQPEVKPGCVLRRSNFAVLERSKLVTDKQAEACKRRMNTFGFVGDLGGDPTISCLYHSEEAENQYLLNPDKALGPEGGSVKSAAAAAAEAAKAAVIGGGGAPGGQ